jgi:hypothetical protein
MQPTRLICGYSLCHDLYLQHQLEACVRKVNRSAIITVAALQRLIDASGPWYEQVGDSIAGAAHSAAAYLSPIRQRQCSQKSEGCKSCPTKLSATLAAIDVGGDHDHHLGNGSEFRWATEFGGSKSPPLFVSAWSRKVAFGPPHCHHGPDIPTICRNPVAGDRFHMPSKDARLLLRLRSASAADEASVISLRSRT